MTIAPAVQAVLELFEHDLAEVRFGDIDAQQLSALSASTRSAADALAAHEAAAEKLRSELNERQEALLQKAQRALAFARIYAENDAELSAKLERISLPKPPKRAKGEPSGKAAASSAVAAPAPEAAPEPSAEVEASAEAEVAPVPAPARKGKRREAARVVARDDEAFDAPSPEA